MPENEEEIRIGDFLLNEDGVSYINPKDDQIIPVCSRLLLPYKTRNTEGAEWGKLCVFIDPEGNEKAYHFHNSVLTGGGSRVVADLVSKGLTSSGHPRSQGLLAQYLRSVNPDNSMLSSSKQGWVRHSFVLPDHSFGSEPVVYSGTNKSHGMSSAGDWKSNVGQYCSGNSRLLLAASAAFAAPLLAVFEMEGGGFHFRGESSTGKSTALEVAASVYGSPVNYMLNWDATKNSMEEVAEAHNDCLMVIDELGIVDGSVVGDTIYMLANGHGKARMGREKRRFRVLTLTSGEVSLAEQMANAGKVTMKGQEVRLLDVAADAGAKMGLFEELHSFSQPADLANHLKAATRKHHGQPLQDFLLLVTSRRQEVETECRKVMDKFASAVTPTKSNGQVSRAIRRFGLVAAAGEIATAHGMTGWKEGEAVDGAMKCFVAWMEHRRTFDMVAMAVDLVKMFILENEERFEVVGDGSIQRRIASGATFLEDEERSEVTGGAPNHRRVGFRKGETFLILPQIFREVVCAGQQHEVIAQALEESDYLNTTGKNRLQKQERISGKLVWGYSIKATIREAS